MASAAGKTRERSPYELAERRRQARWKRTADLPPGARAKGHWQSIPCDFILPGEFAPFNIWSPIRDEVLDYFSRQQVVWHDADNDYGPRPAGPSPHLLDSQVCALNFWWGLARSPGAMAVALRTVFDDVERVVPPLDDDPAHLVVPEWIGCRNYLGERGERRRGQFATSADFLLALVDHRGDKHGVLLESKYTETYQSGRWRIHSERGTDRAAIYRLDYQRPGGPFLPTTGIAIEDLMIEPFDQHLRQQLLATAMEREAEGGFRSVTCVHVAPRANSWFHTRITAPKLDGRGTNVGEAWRSILRLPSRYRSLSYEALFAELTRLNDPALSSWCGYQRARYGWE
jgi:hypothetical protein